MGIAAALTVAMIQACDPTARPCILSVTELDDDGGIDTLSAGVSVIDINSRLGFSVSKDVLRGRALELSGGAGALDATLVRFQQMQRLADQGLGAVESLLGPLADWASDPDDDDRIAALQTALRPVGLLLRDVLSEAPAGTPLRTRINASLRGVQGQAARSRMAFEAVASEAERLRGEVDSILATEGVQVRVGAWLVTGGEEQPLHLQGFDDYPEGEFFESDRWNLALSPEQSTQLDSLTVRARDARERGSGIADGIRPAAEAALAFITQEASQCVESVRGSLRDIEELSGALVGRVVAATGALDELSTLFEELSGGRDASGGLVTDPLMYAARLTGDVTLLTSGVRAVIEPLSHLEDEVVDGLPGLDATVRQGIEGCRGRFENIVSRIERDLGPIASLIDSSNRIDVAGLAFGAEVRRLDLKDVPTATELALKRTGRREEGDVVVIKVAGGTTQDSGRVVQFESHEFRLYKVLVHVNTAVGLIWADPFNASPVNGFQPAASYSIMLSRGSSSSVLYNRLFRTSVGINVAALDFDHDDDVELGMGLVISTLADITQMGVGINLADKKAYWFLGLQLPGGLPGPG